MKSTIKAWTASLLLLATIATSLEVKAQACIARDASTGDAVRLELPFSAFWFQPMTMTVARFDEFVQPRENPGGSFCGVASVRLSGALLDWRANGQQDVLVYTDTFLLPGTRLRLTEFVYTGSNFFNCATVGAIDPCHFNGDLYRSATVTNRHGG